MNIKDIISVYDIINNEYYRLQYKFSQPDKTTVQDVKKYLEEQSFYMHTDISDDVVNIIQNYIKLNFDNDFLQNKAIETIQNLPPQEQMTSIIELMKNRIRLNLKDVLSKEEKVQLFDNLNNISKEDIGYRTAFLYLVADSKDMVDYINSNGKNKKIILEDCTKDYNIATSVVKELNDDFDKANICIELCINDPELLKDIKDSYLRSLILTNETYARENQIDYKKQALDLLEYYREAKSKFEKLGTEEEKTELVMSLKDNDMKIEFLKSIENKENRAKIINSFKNEVSPELKSKVDIVQKMITEFFEDSLGKDFTDEKKERMEMTFKRTDVKYSDDLESESFGASRYYFNDILMNTRMANNTSKMLQFLVHEHGHMLSNFHGKEYKYFSGNSNTIEEGTQDLFAEMVINHYLEKHGSIELDGKKVRMDYPVEYYSGYYIENGWQRTILYCAHEEGLDMQALAEYQLGDRSKYVELVFGKEIASQKPRDEYGNIDINTSTTEIYNAHKEAFKQVDRDSIYYRRNWILPTLELQARLEEKGVDLDLLNLDEGKYLCKYVASKYFDGKKLYEIDSQELQDFVDMVEKNSGNNIVEYDQFANHTISTLEESDMQEYSFEILKNSNIIWHNVSSAGTNMETKLSRCFKIEEEKVDEGQSIAVSLSKYTQLIPTYIKIYSENRQVTANEIILDAAKDLQYVYLDQLDQALEEDREGTIKAITETEDSAIWIDKSIAEVLDKHGVVLEISPKRQSNYSVDDVTRIAIKGKFTLGEIEGLGISLESTKESESIKNYETRL